MDEEVTLGRLLHQRPGALQIWGSTRVQKLKFGARVIAAPGSTQTKTRRHANIQNHKIHHHWLHSPLFRMTGSSMRAQTRACPACTYSGLLRKHLPTSTAGSSLSWVLEDKRADQREQEAWLWNIAVVWEDGRYSQSQAFRIKKFQFSMGVEIARAGLFGVQAQQCYGIRTQHNFFDRFPSNHCETAGWSPRFAVWRGYISCTPGQAASQSFAGW